MWLDTIAADSVSAGGSAPLHRQLSDLLRRAVVDGDLGPRDRFPTETELQGHFGVSRSVVRQALATLAAEGLIQRGRGRGTAVAVGVAQHRSLQRTAGLQTQFAEHRVAVGTEVLAFGRGADPVAASSLGTIALVEMERLRRVGGEPIAYIRTWVKQADVPGLRGDELADASLHETLRSRYGIDVSAGRRQVLAVRADDRIAALLEIEPGSPSLLLEGTSLGNDGLPCEYFRTWHRADRVVFDVDAAEPSAIGTEGGQHAPPAARERESLDAWALRLAHEMESLSAALAARVPPSG
ncbi:GntR family transcriptional regulator [Microbacterium halophytorum]|uniref:GntR family transcriptional regulator n=1 Tax=Microbacterium halophytorum TaxID=2067568 RepID=UPI000CFE27CC|nr:GntR family transcriptional regulator [Microbacterium halophytorum]